MCADAAEGTESFGCAGPYRKRGFHFSGTCAKACCRSSVVEHSLGKGEVDSSILSGSTIHPITTRHRRDAAVCACASSYLAFHKRQVDCLRVFHDKEGCVSAGRNLGLGLLGVLGGGILGGIL